MTAYTIPLSPVLPVNGLRREIDRFFDDAFNARTMTGWMPSVDAREEAEAFVFEFEMPGVSPEAVEVLAEEGTLTVRGERTLRNNTENERRLVSERVSGRFERRFRLPKTADLNAISAQYDLGVLTVRVGKVAPAQPRRIQVAVNGMNNGNGKAEQLNSNGKAQEQLNG